MPVWFSLELLCVCVRLPAQEVGEGVLMLRVLVELVGTLARSIGPSFATDGRLLRKALLPLLEVVGIAGAAPGAASSARAALAAVSSASGLTCPVGSPLQVCASRRIQLCQPLLKLCPIHTHSLKTPWFAQRSNQPTAL